MEFIHAYVACIGWIVARAPAGDKFVHTYVGLAIFVIVLLVLGRNRSPLWALAVAIVAEVGNECIDRIAWGSWRWQDTLGDAAATWFWPLIITALIVTRYRKQPSDSTRTDGVS